MGELLTEHSKTAPWAHRWGKRLYRKWCVSCVTSCGTCLFIVPSESTSCARFFHIHITRETALLSFGVFNCFRLCIFVHVVVVVYCNYSLPNCVYDSASLRAHSLQTMFPRATRPYFVLHRRRDWLRIGNTGGSSHDGNDVPIKPLSFILSPELISTAYPPNGRSR